MNIRVTISDEQIAEIIKQKQDVDVKDKLLNYLYVSADSVRRKTAAGEQKIRDAEEILKSDASTRSEIKSANYSLGKTRTSIRAYEGELRAYGKIIEYILKL